MGKPVQDVTGTGFGVIPALGSGRLGGKTYAASRLEHELEISNRSDIQLVGRAVKERWPISDKIRETLVAKLLEVVIHGEPREIVSAAKVLSSMDKHSTELTEAQDRLTLEELQTELVQRLTELKEQEQESLE